MWLPKFDEAVKSKDILIIRIMLKDSLLVDRSFEQFEKMCNYAKENGADPWKNEEETFERKPRGLWNTELMNSELVKLVDDFTKERCEYCREIIRSIYPYSPPSKKGGGNNDEDYDAIIRNTVRINKILNKNKQKDGSMVWKDIDVDEIQKLSNRIFCSCKKIRSRRK